MLILIAAVLFGYSAYMNGDSGVSKVSACSEMRATMRTASSALNSSPNDRDLIRAMSNLQKVYSDICL